MQLVVPGIPLGVGGKIELADVPAIIGAAFSGPIGGIITGFLHGIMSPTYLALIPATVCSLALLGYLSDNLKMKWKTILAIIVTRVIFDPILGAIFYKLIYYGPSVPILTIWVIGLYYDVPSAMISIPLYLCIEKLPWVKSFLKQ
ncbi:MAG: hypothetical protein QXZ25_04350 [Candidatus Bathyarchaeia archaeon]